MIPYIIDMIPYIIIAIIALFTFWAIIYLLLES